MDYDKLINLATDMGYRLLECGGEIYRVEESVQRILRAYGLNTGEVFAIPNCIIVSMVTPTGRTFTRVRRMVNSSTNIDQLERYNDLCRRLCRDIPSLEEARAQMEALDAAKRELDQLYRDLNEGDLRLEDHGRVMVCISVAEIDDDNDLTNRGERMRLRELLGQDLNATDEWLLVADNRYILDPSHTLDFSDEPTDTADTEGEDR